MSRLALFGTALIGLTLAALSLHVPGEGTAGTLLRHRGVVALLCVSGVTYLGAVWLVLRRPVPARGIWIVLAVSAALRIVLVASPPFLSSDINRYVWDGRVQAAGINPYRYLPADPALAGLRDEAIYPHINRADYAPTIYPPAAQAVFFLAGQAWSSVTGMKLAMVGFDVLAMACLWRLLGLAGLPPERLAIYGWNPLVAWAVAGNGHVDGMVLGLVAAALLLRVRGRDGWTGLVLGLAVATKFFPAVIAPVLWRGRFRLALAAAATILGLYAIYSGVGWRVFGFLSGYGQEEGLETGAGFWLVALLGVPLFAYAGAALLALAALGAWFAFVRRPEGPVATCQAAGIMMGVLTFAISPHYPWYFCWLAVPAVLAPAPALLWLSVAPVLIYIDGYTDSLTWPSIVYAPAVLLLARSLHWPARWPAALPIKGNT